MKMICAAVLGVLAGTAMASPDPATWLEEQDIRLTECGRGTVRALRVIRVGEAVLYRDDCRRHSSPMEAPLRLQFSYRRDVPGDAFGKAAEAMIERNVSAETFAALQERLQAFNARYRDIGDGDTYQLDYGPDGTLLLSLNGELLATEQGDDFAQSYLTVWFGDRPYNDRLKQDLLGH
ncbi:chalcone isomerase family protein [Isoalcanivorax indicus]|uniref:chalcone isomerase family protein n=1 Tax=Isoalcanivorax indicus TaxID=2202653 RepID=UPI000DB98964|nr:chalcone isomerase family protein [Isoalcanivorax indicus]